VLIGVFVDQPFLDHHFINALERNKKTPEFFLEFGELGLFKEGAPVFEGYA
jgi:hypothetical protein